MGNFPGHLPSAHRKTAAFPPQGQSQNAPPEAGASAGATRNIPKDHSFDSRALKPLSKALWASTVALGHTLTAYRHLSRIKSATVSPDGSLGGRGYVMKLAEMRQKLYEASEALSSISDTIFDEISAPHWKPKLAQLDEGDQEDVRRFIDEAQEVMENPEGEAEEEIEAIEEAPLKSRKKPKAKPSDPSKGSKVPDGGDTPAETASPLRPKEASMRPPGLTDRQWVVEFYTNRTAYPSDDELSRQIFVKAANSSEPVGEMPGGPRVDHLGPGTGNGEYGDFSEAETLSPPADPWNADGAGISRREEGGEDYDYTSEWENDFSKSALAPKTPTAEEVEEWWEDASPTQMKNLARSLKLTTYQSSRWNAQDWEKAMDYYVRVYEGDSRGFQRGRNLGAMWKVQAAAGIPDASSDDTKTDAWDFGIGFGAKGDGAGGYENPSGEGNGTKGVEGPHSGLPGAPAQSSGDTTRVVLDDKLNPRQAAFEALYGQALLPQDSAGGVSRSDYFPGAKDNLVSVGTSDLPGDAPAIETGGQPLLNTFHTQEDVRTPYVRFDYTTRNLRGPVLSTGEVK
jgi:hypothetical protein